MDEMTQPKKRGRPRNTEKKKPALPEEKYIARQNQEYGATAEYKPGDNTRIINHFLAVRSMPAVDLDDAQAVDARVWEYMSKCADDDVKPSVEGLAIALHVTRETLNSWGNKRTRDNNPVYSDTVKSAVQMLNAMTATNLQEGKVNPAAGIFLLKNNAGYTDTQQITVEAKDNSIDAPAMADVMQEYAELDAPEV